MGLGKTLTMISLILKTKTSNKTDDTDWESKDKKKHQRK